MTSIHSTVSSNGDSPLGSSTSEDCFTTITTVIIPEAVADGKRRKTSFTVALQLLLLVALMILVATLVVVISRSSNDETMMMVEGTSSIAHHIIGGMDAVEDSYPYVVSLQYISTGHRCGGSLIARDVVLTAAHCQIKNVPLDNVAIGRHNIFNYDVGEDITVRKELPHPTYNYDDTTASDFDNDFMLIFLNHAVNNMNIVPVKLNSNPSFPAVGQYAKSMGWGDIDLRDDWNDDTTHDHTPSDVLKEVELTVISNEDCATGMEGQITINGTTISYLDLYPTVTKNMICTKGSVREDTCQGDSGGPLIVWSNNNYEAVQVGVVSWGIRCASGRPGAYSRVSEAYEWIQRNVCEGSVYASEAGFDCNGIPMCLDKPNWVDSLGLGCDWYEEYPDIYCNVSWAGDMGHALDNCCACSKMSLSSPTRAPTILTYPDNSISNDDDALNNYLPLDMSMSMMSHSTPTPTTSSTADPITMPGTNNTCLTEKDCNDQAKLYGIEFVSGDFPFYGCFSKGGMVCWGRGGTEEQIEEQIDYFREKISCAIK
jgi:secreted trypsin-like serine protease